MFIVFAAPNWVLIERISIPSVTTVYHSQNLQLTFTLLFVLL